MTYGGMLMLPNRCHWGMALILLALLGTCFQAGTFSAAASPARVQGGKGIVVGHIDRCSGLPLRFVGDGRYSAGTVTVLRGQLRWSHGHRVPAFPTQVVKKARVTAHGGYRFVLAPGQYVLNARLPHSNVTPFVRVRVGPGVTLHVDVPNMCI